MQYWRILHTFVNWLISHKFTSEVVNNPTTWICNSSVWPSVLVTKIRIFSASVTWLESSAWRAERPPARCRDFQLEILYSPLIVNWISPKFRLTLKYCIHLPSSLPPSFFLSLQLDAFLWGRTCNCEVLQRGSYRVIFEGVQKPPCQLKSDKVKTSVPSSLEDFEYHWLKFPILKIFGSS